jgi:hypothetical protein
MARAKRLGFGRVSTDFKGERKLNEDSRPQILAASAQDRPVPPGGAEGCIARRLIHGDHKRTGASLPAPSSATGHFANQAQTFNGNRMHASRLTAHVPFLFKRRWDCRFDRCFYYFYPPPSLCMQRLGAALYTHFDQTARRNTHEREIRHDCDHR